MLDDARCRRVNCLFCSERLRVASEEDALALAASLWLYNERLVAFLVDLCQELLEVSWQVESWREKVVVVGEH